MYFNRWSPFVLLTDLNHFLLVSPKVVTPGPVVRAIQGSRLSCTANGTLPIYIAIIRNSTTLVNTTNTASIRVDKNGNYTCQATSNYGTDERQFEVIYGEEIVIFCSNT